MGFFNNFFQGPGPGWPYADLHQLNLNWIIYEVKKLGHDVEEYKEQLDQMGVDIAAFREYINNIDDTIQEQVAREVPIAINHEIQTGGFNSLLSTAHKRRVVFIGDSYGDGWTPDGTYTSWIDKVANLLYLSNADYIHVSQGGAGFFQPASEGMRNIGNMINYAYSNIVNPETVTDIIIGLGYNDRNSTQETIKTGIENAIVICQQKFPQARRHLFAIGFGTDPAEQYKLKGTYTAYKDGFRDYQFYNISDVLCVKSFFSSDGVHPVEAGQNAIALAIVRCLEGSEIPNINYNDVNHNQITFEMVFGGAADVDNWFALVRGENNRMYFTTVGHFKNVTIANTTNSMTGAQLIKLAKIKTCPLTGFNYSRPLFNVDTTMYYQLEGSNTFYQVPVGLTIASDADTGDTSNVYLWVELKAIADNGSGFKNLTNVKTIGFIGACIEVPFITKTEGWNYRPDLT